MSKLTFKIKHNQNFIDELKKAKEIAVFGLQHQILSSKYVKQFGLPSKISCQVLRKYVRNKKCKIINSVKLTIPGQAIKYRNDKIWISCLKLTLEFKSDYLNGKKLIKINQIELDETFAYICCSVEDEIPMSHNKYIGVDRNATGHIAVISYGNKIIKLGKAAPHINRKCKYLRKSAQKKKAFSFLKKLKNKESHKTKDINHKISKKIVVLAKENLCDIKLERLTGITKKKTHNKKLNNIKSNWSFYQLGTMIEYKAKSLGVVVHYIDPQFTSQKCSRCGLLGTRDMKLFVCSCGHKDHADANAAFNIANAPLHVSVQAQTEMCLRAKTDVAQVAMV